MLAGCDPGQTSDQAPETSLYSLVDGVDGVYFLPPLGPEPLHAGAFDATLLDGLSIAIDAVDAAGDATRVATFDATTTPAVSLAAAHERYIVDLPAAMYLTDPTKSYRILAYLDGAELGRSVLSDRVFEVLASSPRLKIGAHVRIEGTGAVRAIAQTAGAGGPAPLLCPDGTPTKDVALCADTPATAAAPTGLRVAIYSGTGAESSTTLALYRAIASLGHLPMAITRADLVAGRLTSSHFDVLVLPPGEDGRACCEGHYADPLTLNDVAATTAMRAFVGAGGGLVAEEAGALFAAQNGGTFDIYSGMYTAVPGASGRQTLTIVASAFGSGTQQIWQSTGGGYFPYPPAGVTVIARDAARRATIVGQSYGAGRIALTSYVLELRGDSELDWTIWDDWAMGGVHPSSAGAWALLGRLIGWAHDGDASAPTITAEPSPTGARVAMVASHTLDGGAWPGLLPAFGRSIAASGHLPLAVRFDELRSGRLTAANFQIVAFPGGYAYGYLTGLAGHEEAVRSFVAGGGGYYGVCAGAYYASQAIVWEGVGYDYPLGLFQGVDVGPIADIAEWPGYALTPVDYSGGSAFGSLGSIQTMYFGGAYHALPTDAEQGAPVSVAGTFAYSGSASGEADLVTFRYGAGRVALSTTHPEAKAGTNDDWVFWDNYLYGAGTPVTNPDDPWRVIDAVFDGWLAQP
ncbi:BPL-N domain-containing protein [Myxococcota bacterium]|nr:BPL-N domain-containing protein [Myxococcota bacterium]